MENQPITNSSDISSTNPVLANQPPIQPQTKTNLIMPIVITLLVSGVVFGLGGYFFGKQSLPTQKVVENIQTSPTAISSPTPFSSPSVAPTVSDSTSNWETYNSSEYSFKHPKGLKSDTGAAGTGFENIRFQLMGPKQIASGRTQTSLFDGYSFVVTKIGLATQKTPEQLATERRSNSKENCGPEVILSDVKPITVGKGTGVQYSVKNCMEDYTSSYISNGTNVYEITQLYVGELADQKAYEEITDQIFSSLKFL
ncbi:hypothetical protein C4559_06570 [Candidatus Microgenomates bacterium]|nr:MAG: hypothetical protein C4559_06570 [Candidatus Microgenomates bacterium]